jgi:hypothetical protein
LQNTYEWGKYPSDVAVRTGKIGALITALSNNSVNASNVWTQWTAAAWDRVEDVNVFLGLCLALSLLAKGTPLDMLDTLPLVLKPGSLTDI